jgi:hypothetical protein
VVSKIMSLPYVYVECEQIVDSLEESQDVLLFCGVMNYHPYYDKDSLA